MTIGDLTQGHVDKVMRIDGLPPRVIDSVRHYRIRNADGGKDWYTSVIHRDVAGKPTDPAAEYRAVSSTPVEVRSA